ncbi:hypothetical protein FG05_35102 [Fusarium graminearum]
MVLM